MARLTLGGGCFWCLDSLLRRVEGVDSVVCGYAGGTVSDPTYPMVTTGKTGHAEVVQVVFDETKVPEDVILRMFFAAHDATQVNRQGADIGTQYRSVILYETDAQKDLAKSIIDELQAKEGVTYATELKPLDVFYPAEDFHQNFWEMNPGNPYCAVTIGPKVMKFAKEFGQYLKGF